MSSLGNDPDDRRDGLSPEAQDGFAALRRDVEYLKNREEIRDLHVKYCRGVDRVDRDLLRSVFHDDARIHQPPWFDGSTDEYVDLVVGNSTGGFEGAWAHLVTNELIVMDGERAESEWVLFQIDRMEDHGHAKDFIMCGRYLERLERRKGVWRVAERLFVHDIVRLDDVGLTWGQSWPQESGAAFGQRSRDDWSYGFALLGGCNGDSAMNRSD